MITLKIKNKHQSNNCKRIEKVNESHYEKSHRLLNYNISITDEKLRSKLARK